MEQQFKNLVKKTRSYRRFDESYKISNEFLKDWSGPKEGERPTAYIFIGAFHKNEVVNLLKIDSNISPLYMIALGRAGENIKVEPLVDNNYAYSRNKDGIHHVPKRELQEILLKYL